MSADLETSTALAIARAATQAALEVAETSATGAALVPAGADAAMAVKSQMATAHAQVAHARKAALEKVQSAREAIKAQQAELDRQTRALEMELAPLKEKLQLMKEGIWTMNLYLGRDEEIVQLAAGAPAPAGTPIHVRQLVLAMDEESAINAEGGGIDFHHVESFDEWLTSDPAHLQQVLPEQRGVVAIMARRSDIDYGDTWANVDFNRRNRHTYWVIRNGENVYRMDTEFETGPRLVPARDEFTSIFVDRWTRKPLEPGTTAWLEAEKAAGARERHFMRVALILQGLIDRTPVFHPLPKVGVSLLSPEDYDAGHVVLIADDENQITTGRTPFYEWLSALNGQLRTGMRVMIATRHHDWPRRSTDRYFYDHHERISPPTAESPRSGSVYTIARRGQGSGEFIFTYPRTREGWLDNGRGGQELRAPKTNASCRIFATDRFVVPIDLVDVDTMRTYMASRLERHAYIDMFPTLRAAIEFKEAEAAAEAPFRDLLAAQVAQAEGVDVPTAHQLIDPVIATWKVGNRWFRPMTGGPATEAKAAKAILAERARIARANAGADEDATFVTWALREHPQALLVARKKDGTYVVLTPAERSWANVVDGRGKANLPHDIWVHQHEYTRTGKARPVKEWVIPAMSSVATWISLHEASEWGAWNRVARRTDHLSDPEIGEVIERIRAREFDGMTLMAIGYDESGGWWNDDHSRQFTAWYHPGPIGHIDRPLTDGVPHLCAATLKVWVTKERDGTLSLRWKRGEPTPDNTTNWRVPFNHGLDRTRTERPAAPWSDNRKNDLVWIDEPAFATASRHADQWEAARHAASLLGVQADQALHGVEGEWLDRQVAEAKARFLEDYADEALWAEEEKRVRGKVVPPWRGHGSRHGHEDAWCAVRYLVRRLAELGRIPWGMTVAEAAADLGETLNPRAGSWQKDWYRPDALDAADLPEDIAELRFAPEPTGTEIAVREDA